MFRKCSSGFRSVQEGLKKGSIVFLRVEEGSEALKNVQKRP